MKVQVSLPTESTDPDRIIDSSYREDDWLEVEVDDYHFCFLDYGLWNLKEDRVSTDGLYSEG